MTKAASGNLLEMSATRQRTSPREEAAPVREQGLKALVRSLKDEAEMEAIADALEKTHWCRKDAAQACWASVTRRCFTRSGSSALIRDARRGQIPRPLRKQNWRPMLTLPRKALPQRGDKIRQRQPCNSVPIWDSQSSLLA